MNACHDMKLTLVKMKNIQNFEHKLIISKNAELTVEELIINHDGGSQQGLHENF